MKIGLAGLLFGVLFGFTLGWAQLTEQQAIRDMLLLRDPYAFLMMGSGVATAFLGTRLLRWRKARALVDGKPVSWTISAPKKEHVWGSVLFGAGWALALACPGPVTAQLGRGQVGVLLTVAGLISGVALAARFKERKANEAAAVTVPVL